MTAKATTRRLCYPHPRGASSTVNKKEIHPTAGLAYNWALDFVAHGGTPVLAVEAFTIWKLSGHDPDGGVIGGDIFGWNTYGLTRDGLLYFYTHQSQRFVNVGDKVARGAIIGTVGHWPHDEGRSHTHLGVTHPMGIQASKRAILNVADAPRILGKLKSV